jgi:hypothetical protein
MSFQKVQWREGVWREPRGKRRRELKRGGGGVGVKIE